VASVEVRFTALPEHVRTARLIAAAVARRIGIDGSLLDEIRLAVGEACSRAVGVHQRLAPDRPVALTIIDEPERLVVSVADDVGEPEAAGGDDPFAGLHMTEERPAGPGGPDDPLDALPSGFGLAIIAGLVDDLDVMRTANGTVVRMTWKVPSGVRPASGPLA
jgi:anti-sigma regulatory factor (Ser/Thr protein kinase)